MHLKTKLIYYLARAAAPAAFYSGFNRLLRQALAAVVAETSVIVGEPSALVTIHFSLLPSRILTSKY
jgi:hypothetical protein